MNTVDARPGLPASPLKALSDYAELHTVTNFSFLCGASHPEEMVERALTLGYRGLAITDDCSMAGVVRAHQGWQDAIRAGVPGAEGFRLMIGSSFDVHEETLGEAAPAFTLIALACHRLGYGLLCEFITRLRRGATGKGQATLWRRDIRAAELGDCVLLLDRKSVV
jgi:error-prone DNA polymerase